MSLDTLPPELIFEIASYLPKKTVVSLGLRTRNKQILTACKPLLKRLATARGFEQRMLERFGYGCDLYQTTWPRIKKDHYRKLGYEKRLGRYVDDKPTNGECLEPFTGKLHWLRPTDQQSSWQQQEYSTEIETQRLKAQAVKLGVDIPDAFLALMRDEKLQSRIEIIGGGTYIGLGDGLRKCVPSLQNGGDAYIIRFYNDQQGCSYTSLYLDAGPEKGHCVLFSELDPNSEGMDEDYNEGREDLEACLGKDVATEMEAVLSDDNVKPAWTDEKDLRIMSCDFEEWLAMEYFSSCFDRALDEDDQMDLGAPEEAYVRYNFSVASGDGKNEDAYG